MHWGQIDHDRWWALPAGGISTSWFTGLVAQVDGTAAINLVALGILAIGTTCLGLMRRWELNQVEKWKSRQMAQIAIDEARRESLKRVPDARAARTPDPDRKPS